MEQGFNSDISTENGNFHIQTEDWGRENPFIVSRIFKQGQVIRSVKTSYQEVLPKGVNADIQSIRLAVRVQHESILDLLVSGQLFR